MKKLLLLSLCILLNARLNGFDQCDIAAFVPLGCLVSTAAIWTVCLLRQKSVKEDLECELTRCPYKADERPELKMRYKASRRLFRRIAFLSCCCTFGLFIPLAVLPAIYC